MKYIKCNYLPPNVQKSEGDTALLRTSLTNRRGGLSLKMCDLDVRPTSPLPFSNLLPIDPLIFTVCSHLMTPIFEMLSHLTKWSNLRNKMLSLNDPHFQKQNAFTEWPPHLMNNWYFVLQYYKSLAKYFFSKKLRASLKDAFCYSPHQNDPLILCPHYWPLFLS